VLALPLMAQFPAPDTYNNLWYTYCGPTSVNRSVNLCAPPDGSAFDSRTQTITMRITDTHWPLTYTLNVNGREVFAQPQSIGTLDFISIVPLDTTVSGPQTLKYTFHDAAGSFSKTFTASNDPSPCSTPTAAQIINLCTLTDGESVKSPVHVGYAVNEPSTGTMYSSIWVDGVQLGSFNTGKNIRSSNEWVMMYPGKHRLTVQARAQGGTSYRTTVNVTVTSPTDVCKPDRTTDPGVTICSLTDGETVNSPVRVQANAGGPFTLTQIYVDGQAVFTDHAKEIDTNVTMTPGTHRLTVQSKSNSVGTFKKTIYITVQ
jgi:hypothetical protein